MKYFKLTSMTIYHCQILLLVGAMFFSLFVNTCHAESLVFDLYPKVIKIDHSFKGVPIYVSIVVEDEETKDLVVVVRGPMRPYRVLKKERIFGIWVNAKSFTTPYMVSYYSIAATKELSQITDLAHLKRYDLDNALEKYYVEEKYPEEEMIAFRNHFKQYLEKVELYPSKITELNQIAPNFYRTELFIPEHAYVGEYLVEVYAFKNKKMVAKKSIKLTAQKYGLYAKIEELSQNKPLQYSLMSVIIALSAGAIAGFVFRKDR